MTDFSVYDYEPVDIGGNTIYPIDDDGDIELIDYEGRSVYINADKLVAQIKKWKVELTIRRLNSIKPKG